MKAKANRLTSFLSFFVVVVLLACSTACAFLWMMRESAINTPASLSPDTYTEADAIFSHTEAKQDPFPHVDWAYWEDVNEDVIGWITIPGTSIDHPIVQARNEDPLRYLTHDVHGRWNPFGSVYLDADCVERGLESKHCVISGHTMNLAHEGVFGEVGLFSDASYAACHTRVLIQTPLWKKTLEVLFVDVVDGAEPSKLTDFADDDEFRLWLESQKADSAVMLSQSPQIPQNLYTLCTCSYGTDNERTLVFAAELT